MVALNIVGSTFTALGYTHLPAFRRLWRCLFVSELGMVHAQVWLLTVWGWGGLTRF